MIEIIPQLKNIDKYVTFAEENNLSFEYNDFFVPDILDDKDEIKKRINIYKNLNRSRENDTLHGAFYDIVHFSPDRKVKELSIKRMKQTLEIALELGCKGIIFHSNIVSVFANSEFYVKSWLEDSIETIKYLIKESNNSIEIYFENMLDSSPKYLCQLTEHLKDEKNFGICLDIAHLHVMGKEPVELWFKELSPFIKHFHLNDTNLRYDDHLAIGSGKINWLEIDKLIQKHNLRNVSKLIEVNSLDKIKKSIDYISNHSILK